MSDELSEDSFMECPTHGRQRPTVICQHLQHGVGCGFQVPNQPDFEMPWLQMAWCDECDAVLQEEGEWNDRSEGFAGIMFVCEGCFNVVRKRNTLA